MAGLLDGRWTVGYLNNIGLKEATKKALIGNNAEEYINLAPSHWQMITICGSMYKLISLLRH